jgi:hypothetical protein
MDSAVDAAKLSDRELLLLLHERQGVMGRDVRELKDGTQTEIAGLRFEVSSLKDLKADKAAVEQLDRGQRRLFNYLWFAFGVLGVLQILVPIVAAFIHRG